MARSSAEIEFCTTQGICELSWLKNLMKELRMDPIKPMRIYSENKATTFFFFDRQIRVNIKIN